jgi:hypothetical protein
MREHLPDGRLDWSARAGGPSVWTCGASRRA